MNGYWCLFIFKNLKKKSHLIFIECVFCECVSIWLKIRKLLSKFFVLLFPQQLMCRETLNPHQIMRGLGSSQSSSLGRQSHSCAAQIPMFMLCCFHLSAVSLWDNGSQKPRAPGLSAQYKLLVDYTSPLVSQLDLSYSGLTACVVCLQPARALFREGMEAWFVLAHLQDVYGEDKPNTFHYWTLCTLSLVTLEYCSLGEHTEETCSKNHIQGLVFHKHAS